MERIGTTTDMEEEETKLIKALRKDYKELYVKEYTTGWRDQRLMRNIELGIMSLKNTEEYIEEELDKAREEGRREQQRLDCELYGTAVATNEEIEEKWNLSKLKNNDNMEVKEKMSEDFIRGYNEAIRDILAKRGMWAGADKKLLKELSNYLKEEK